MFVRFLLLIVVVLAILLLMAGQFGMLRGKQPSNLGVSNGKLKAPSPTENSVSSQAALHAGHPMQTYAAITPLAYTGEAAAAWTRLEAALATLPRTTIVTNSADATGRYLYAQSSTLLLRFTDDVEFWQDDTNKVIHVRSSSRLGRKDFGVNRNRIETIRSAFGA
ncbi:MAG: hypothetical protein RLY82_1142 [Pseudomonadota bacterium]|jgi:uncharacterized protein (DUF1499 family)